MTNQEIEAELTRRTFEKRYNVYHLDNIIEFWQYNDYNWALSIGGGKPLLFNSDGMKNVIEDICYLYVMR